MKQDSHACYLSETRRGSLSSVGGKVIVVVECQKQALAIDLASNFNV